jgi:alpha-L-fucosidase 2
MISRKIRSLYFFLLAYISSVAQTQPLTLWYEQPAEKWTDALPIGNGRLGGMIYGGVQQDHIQFNEETLWTGRPRSHARVGAVKYLDTIRALLQSGKQAEAEALAGKYFMGLKDPDDSAYARSRAAWLKKVLQDKSPAAIHYDDSHWGTMQLPTPDGWERTGLDGLDGVVWFRTTFELPSGWQGKDIMLDLGRIRDMDVTYLNGEKIGSSEGNNNLRQYVLRSSQLKAGRNTLAIQVINFFDKGGLAGRNGLEKRFFIYPASGGDTVFLSQLWKYNIQADDAPAFPRYEADYQPFGDLFLSFPNIPGFTKYHRELDINTAIAKTTYSCDGVTYTREYLASAPQQCIAVRITADKGGSIDCHALLQSPHRGTAVKKSGNNTLALSLQVTNGALNGAAYLFAKASGGKLTVNEKEIVCTGADTLTFYLVAATNFNNYRDVSGNAAARCAAYLQKIRNINFSVLKKAHIKDYQKYFDRFSIYLHSNNISSLPTDKRLRAFSVDKDPALISLYLQYGRYLLLSSSRPGTQPANLQGIWNNLLSPPWGSKYTSNINLEMKYWPSDLLNLAECEQPLFKMISELSEAGKQTAKEYYGAPGWVLHHNTDLWRGTAPINASNHGIWVTGGAWLCQHLWDHYLFTQDKNFLKQYYPVMREAARFFVHFLVKDPKTGWLISTPSNSPEQGGLVAGPSMDHQLIRELFRNCIAAAAILNTDADFSSTLKNKLSQIAPDQIGKHGQLQEWLEDKDDPSNRHRHVSHLWAVYPGTGITWKDSALMKAARQSLIYRGDGGTGWSLAWKVNLWARFKDGDHTLKMIKALLEPATDENGNERGGAYNNLFDAHPPFQIDGNFGGAAGIAEMFVQSHENEIELLPALPTALPTGFVKGIGARGGFMLDVKWQQGKLVQVVVYSQAGNECRLRYKDQLIKFETKKGNKYTFSGSLDVVRTVADTIMNRIYNEIKTPHKYGLILIPEKAKMMDCPAVFRKDNSWYMTYIVFDGKGYETWLAKSDNLLQWKTLGKILSFSSDTTEWDALQKAGYISLQDPTWGGSYAWQSWNNKYWMSYIGGNAKGYEAGDLSMGIAWTSSDPTTSHEWERIKTPVLSSKDNDVRWWENRKIFKSSVIWDKDNTTGHPFVMYYNANGDTAKNNTRTRWFERVGMAVSDDMIHWKRFGEGPVMHHFSGITGDAVIQKMDDIWVMFYFGAFWDGRKDAFNRFACSYDLVNWTDWTGPDLIAPSQPFDERYAHKPYLIKHKGVVYHFYCAVNNKDQRGIAVATSVDMGKSKLNF